MSKTKSFIKDPSYEKGWLTTEEAAHYLGKSRNSLWLLLSRGFLIKRKWRRRLYFKKSELDHILEYSSKV